MASALPPVFPAARRPGSKDHGGAGGRLCAHTHRLPILGYPDDTLLLPLGIWLAVRMVRKAVWEECRQRAEGMGKVKGPRWMMGVIIGVWGILLLAAVLFVLDIT